MRPRRLIVAKALSLLWLGCGGIAPAAAVKPASVSLSPKAISLKVGETQQFTASVTNTMSWSVKEGRSGGSVSTSGLYTAPATPGTYHVIATSAVDSTVSASAD